MGSGICSAAWRKRAEPSPSRLAPCHLPREGEVLLYLPEGAKNFPAAAEAFTRRGKVARSAG